MAERSKDGITLRTTEDIVRYTNTFAACTDGKSELTGWAVACHIGACPFNLQVGKLNRPSRVLFSMFLRALAFQIQGVTLPIAGMEVNFAPEQQQETQEVRIC